jgi:RNA polymerase sigma-70 factor (ECF subfamily)
VDGETLKKAQEGDARAVDALLSEVEPQIYRFGLRMCRHPEDAEDVLQETMLSLVKNLESYRGESKLSTWALTIARSFCLKKRRKRQGEPAALGPLYEEALLVPSSASDQHRDLETKESWTAVSTGISRLSQEFREVLLLRDVEGLSAEETAQVLGLGLAAMKSRLHRARKLLRSELLQVESGPSCPDIAVSFSQELEGDLSPASCAEIERHIKTCAPCKAICSSLTRDLRICQSAPALPVPPDVAARIRQALRSFLIGRTGA